MIDLVYPMRTLSLRIVSGLTLLAAVLLFAVDWLASWYVRLDTIGLAQLLEKRYPELAERLVTLVQLPADQAQPGLASLLRAETERTLAAADPRAACPLTRERKRLMWAAGILTTAFVALAFVPAFGGFTLRFLTAWATPLVPFAIEVRPAYALRGGNCTIEASYQLIDETAEAPTDWQLFCESDGADPLAVPMMATAAGTFEAVLTSLHQPQRFRVKAGEVESDWFDIHLIDAPIFASRPTLTELRPAYTKSPPTRSLAEKIEVLQYSKTTIAFALDRRPVRAILHVRSMPRSTSEVAVSSTIEAIWQENGIGSVADIAERPGEYEAELRLELGHGLHTTLPVGKWTVRPDAAPRFTQSLRLVGGAALSSRREYPIGRDDSLKLQTVIEDDEGLDDVAIEIRINEEPPRLQKWMKGSGRTKLLVDQWLPVPSTLKPDDRVQFRVHAGDRRNLKKGEVHLGPRVLPPVDLTPQVTIAPNDGGTASAWITLHVTPAVESFVKEQTQKQADELRDVINAIRQKVQSEIDQVQPLQRSLHLNPVLTVEQAKQADKIRALNRDIIEDLLAAGKRFGAEPDLAKLAEHFFAIAETDMLTSALALKRFGAKDRPLADSEKELQTSQDALISARKKLDRMVEWNKLLAQDRLDQFEIDKLAKRQTDLAEQVEKLIADEALADAEKAKQMEAIRQEQAKIAEKTESLQAQSQLAKETMESMQAERAKQLAEEARQLAAEQRGMNDTPPDKLPPELKDRLAKLAKQQADLAERVKPFAEKNQGPDAKPAAAAADALNKPQLGEALRQQQAHEKQLEEWLTQLMPVKPANKLRAQALQLAKQQEAIRKDLELLSKEAAQIDYPMLQKRMQDLLQREKELAAAIAKLPTDDLEEPIRRAKKIGELSALRAAEQLMRDNAEGAPAAHRHMKQAELELDALAGLLPDTLPIDRKEIKDDALRAKIERVEQFGKEQAQLRKETEGLLADAMKASAGKGGTPLAEKADKLASELLKLSQSAGKPEMKAMAKESMQDLEAAKKSLEASNAMQAKGDDDQAKKLRDDAALKLEMAAKKLEELAKDAALKATAKTDAAKTAEMIKEGVKQMRQAEKKLPSMPKDAELAMQAAAKKLTDASQQANKQSASRLPIASRNPALREMKSGAGVAPLVFPKELKLESLKGKAWGELSGELKTQMLQDVRARFGAEYEETIRLYFEGLAETPAGKRKD